MMKKMTIMHLCFLVVYGCSCLTAYGQHDTHTLFPERLLPDTTMAVWVSPHFAPALQHAAEAVPVDYEASAVSELLASFDQLFQRNFTLSLSDLASVCSKTVAVALLDLRPPDRPEQFWPIPEFVLLVDIQGVSDTLTTILETHIIPSLQSQVPGIEVRRNVTHGITSYTFSHGKTQYTCLLTERLLALGGSPESVEQLISRLPDAFAASSDQSEHLSLFHSETYRIPREKIFRHEHDSRLYVDVQSIWRTLRPFIRQRCFSSQHPENQFLFQLLELYELTTFSWQVSFTETGGRERFFWTVASQEEPLEQSFSLLSGFLGRGNGILTSDLIVPGKVLFYEASRVDVLQIWRHLNLLINMFLSVQQQEQFQRHITMIERYIGLDVEQELLSSFGQEMAIACLESTLPGQRNTFLSTENFPCALFLQVNDQDTVQQALQRLATRVPQSPVILDIGIPGSFEPLHLYAAFVRDFLVFSASRSTLQHILRVAEQGGSLASAPDYRTLSSSFSLKGYARGYINLPSLFQRLPDRSIFRANRPPEQGMMWRTTSEDGGFLTESFSPFGGVLVGAAAFWFGLME
ncbi:hypothetical protein CSA56_17625 [candidate division KSB3 bacterium]|uniref:DUF3352 domain-containing protein n=1 Tax=candidate division KSB3 bacterium TaxID=2044937 RepID=A0A2G6K9K8_9BACT|nr:MAG: hypothetical protein CSA56_17625 [candidate division KSB3 bacterium]